VRFVRSVVVILVLASSSGVAPAIAYAQQPAEQQGAFVPAESLPQRERMPAAPLLVAAYAFVMLALFGYVISVSRRLTAVKTDLTRLEGEIRRTGRG
jgi:type VI protein secretion system component VasF